MKWSFLILILVALILLMYLTSKRVFQAEIYIQASPEDVWSVLVDQEAYKNWNPLLVPASGEFVEGTSIVYRMTPPEGDPSEFKSEVRALEPYKLIKQFAGMPILLTADHEWRLEAVEGGTRVQQYEVDKGIWMWFWDAGWVQPSYEQVNKALKRRVLEIVSTESAEN